MVANPMAVESTPNVVAVGATAGGVEALTQSAAGQPPDLPGGVAHASRGAERSRPSERYEAIADEAEHAMAVLGHRLSEAYGQREHSG